VHLSDHLVLVRGGGEFGTGVAVRLHRAGFTVMVTELAQPRCLRRAAALAEAVYAGSATVEGVQARLADDPMTGMAFTVLNDIPLVIDTDNDLIARMQPRIVVDARRPLPPPTAYLPDNCLVIGLGAGHTAGVDCHAVVETARGPHLGRVYWEGGVEVETDAPEPGVTVVTAPVAGVFAARTEIGAVVPAGAALGVVVGELVLAPHARRVCGLLHDGLAVSAGEPVAELDADDAGTVGFFISDQARAVGGGVLEAILTGLPQWQPPEDPDKGRP